MITLALLTVGLPCIALSLRPFGLDLRAGSGVFLLILCVLLLWPGRGSGYEPRQLPQVLLTAALVFVGGFLLELLGVQTGWPFGVYHYLTALGPQLAGTPLLIGCNWLLVVASSLAWWPTASLKAAILGSSLMLILDLLIEPLAPRLTLWQWAAGGAGPANYLAWWLAGLGFCYLVRRWGCLPTGLYARSLYLLLLFYFGVLHGFLQP